MDCDGLRLRPLDSGSSNVKVVLGFRICGLHTQSCDLCSPGPSPYHSLLRPRQSSLVWYSQSYGPNPYTGNRIHTTLGPLDSHLLTVLVQTKDSWSWTSKRPSHHGSKW